MTAFKTFTHSQAQALAQAQVLEAEALCLVRALGTIGNDAARADTAAHAARLNADTLTLRETVGYVDLRAYSAGRAQRRAAATDAAATRHTLRLLSVDRVRSVRRAASASLAAREAGDTPPAAVGEFTSADPRGFVRG